MRIAMIPTPALRSEWGSTLHAVSLAHQLAEAGIEVHVYCLDHPARPPSAVRFHDLPLPLSHPVLVDAGISDAQLMSFTRLVAEAIVAEHAVRPFDVVHAHYATVTGLAGVVACTITGAPLVVSSFGRDLHVGADRDPRYARMVALTTAHARAILASNAGVARRLVERYAVPEDRVAVVPMGVDTRLFSSRALRPELRAGLLRGAERLIVNVSSCFGVEKGIEVLLRAARRLQDGGHRVAVAIVGGDDYEDLREEQRLRRLAAELGVEGSVTFVGRLPHADVPSYLAAADLVVDPRLVGSFSSAVLEALFAGAVVVASDVPSNVPLFADRRAGVMHRAGDDADLAAQAARLLTDTAARDALRRNLAAWATGEGALFTAAAMRDRTIDVYQRVTTPAEETAGPRS